MPNEEKKKLSEELGIDEDHFNTIARKLIERIAISELTGRVELIKEMKEFTDREKDLLACIGFEHMIMEMYGQGMVMMEKSNDKILQADTPHNKTNDK